MGLRTALCESSGPDGVVWVRDGIGPAIRKGQFAALHFTVYSQDGTAVESSRMMSHPCVLEACPPAATDPELREFAGAPVALREVRRRGLLCSAEARAGRSMCFL